MSNNVGHAPEWRYTVVDVSDNITTITSNPALFRGACVTTTLSTHALPILDGSNTIAAFAADAAIGTQLDGHGVRCETNLVVDPNDAATGFIAVYWKPNLEGLVG